MGRVEDLVGWGRRTGEELAKLPDTLENFRVGAANFRALSERLSAATVVFERASSLLESSGVADAVRSLDEATTTFERQMTQARSMLTSSVPGAGLMEEAAREFQRNLERTARLLGVAAPRSERDE